MKKVLLAFAISTFGFAHATAMLDPELAELTQKIYKLEKDKEEGVSLKEQPEFQDFKNDLLSLKLVCKYKNDDCFLLSLIINHSFSATYSVEDFFSTSIPELINHYLTNISLTSEEAYRFLTILYGSNEPQREFVLNGLNANLKRFYNILAGGSEEESPAELKELDCKIDLWRLDHGGFAEPAILAKLDRLESLSFGYGAITKNPVSIFQLTNLIELEIDACWIEENQTPLTIPEELGRMTKLQRLSFADCKNIRLPNSLWTLTNLESLNLNYTLMEEISDALRNLTRLTSLDIGYNNLETPPAVIRGLTNLQTLEIGGNPFINDPVMFDELTSWFLPNVQITTTEYFVQNPDEPFIEPAQQIFHGTHGVDQ